MDQVRGRHTVVVSVLVKLKVRLHGAVAVSIEVIVAVAVAPPGTVTVVELPGRVMVEVTPPSVMVVVWTAPGPWTVVVLVLVTCGRSDRSIGGSGDGGGSYFGLAAWDGYCAYTTWNGHGGLSTWGCHCAHATTDCCGGDLNGCYLRGRICQKLVDSAAMST
jgi:hypothetical protein